MEKLSLAEERQLVQKAKESLAAFSKLYEYYLPKIYSYCLNRTGSKEIAEDVTADTFLKAMKKIDQFEYRGFTFGSWLYRIAHNSICDYYKKNKETLEIEKVVIATESTSPEIMKRIDYNNKIRQVLNRLKNDYQQILTLKFFEELTNSEIAEVIGCSPNALNVKLHRSINAFRKQYLNIFGEEGGIVLS